MEFLSAKDIELKYFESHNNQDVFYLLSNEEYLKFRLWFTNSGFFTKLEIIEKSQNISIDDLKKWLINAN